MNKRAKNMRQQISEWFCSWRNPTDFMALTQDKVIAQFNHTKEYKPVRNVGEKTLAEILELHKLLNELWGA